MIKSILDELSLESKTTLKLEILEKHKNNDLFKEVLLKAYSKRIKFWIRQIPEYVSNGKNMPLEWAFEHIEDLSNREVTGGKAIEHLKYILSSLSKDDAIVIERIIGKDLKIGCGEKLINKVFKDLIPITPYMGAKAFDRKVCDYILSSSQKVSQVKMDGRYCNAVIENGEVELLSRQGETTNIGSAKLISELETFDDCVLNGELTIEGIHRYTANGIVSSIIDIESKRETRTENETIKHINTFEKEHGDYNSMVDRIKYTVWDIIELDDYYKCKSSVPYNIRLERLENVLTKDLTMISIVEQVEVDGFKDVMDHFKEIVERGDEGTILKSLTEGWKNGKPKWQMKVKKEDYYDLKIVGFNYGTKGTKNELLISSLNVETEDGMLKTSPGGITEADMKYITENQESLMGCIVEVKCSGLSKDKSGNYALLHPVFIKIRDDKTIANTLQECIEIDKMISELN